MVGHFLLIKEPKLLKELIKSTEEVLETAKERLIRTMPPSYSA